MTATCACGRTAITVNTPPSMLGVCHCSNCKRRTGSAFGMSAYFPRKSVVRQEGDTKGHDQQRHFCSTCGTTLFWFVSTMPGQIGIAGGCFAEQGLPEPTYSVSDAKREPWVTLPAGWQVWAD